MTPGEVLQVLRTRGYSVALEAGALVVHRDEPPKDAERAAGLLRDHRAGLEELLRTEQHPDVRRVLDVFQDARLVRVERTTKGAA